MAWSEMDYLQTVRNIATEAITEYPFADGQHSDERQEYVSETVDGNEYVIYYGANEIALRATDNEPDDINPIGSDWRTHRSLATYLAMEMDVLEEINKSYHRQAIG